MTESVERIAEFCEQNELPWDGRTAERLALYLELLQHFNGTMNLIGPMTEREVVDQLLIDSLTAAAAAEPDGAIMDVGAGAGLPGIPLACLYPDTPVTLVEPRRKRNTFLKIIQTRLELDHLDLVHERLENTPGGPYHYVIAKAFQPPLEWIETASEWRSDEGVIVCMTRPGEREGIEKKASELGLELVGACDDTTELGAPGLEDVRAVYVVG
jgi:16S rRNA (guanine527-N7)-methyltransferase